MSAFMVGKPHIDALVGLAWLGPKGYNRRSWYAPNWGIQRVSDLVLNDLGRDLWGENRASIQYRYPDTRESGEYPGPIGLNDDAVDLYEFPMMTFPRPTAVEGLKIISCYEYQSCEHPGWETSAAKAFCEELRALLVSCLPGYEDAPWEWTRATGSTPETLSPERAAALAKLQAGQR